MRRNARTALAVALALGLSACDADRDAADARTAADDGLASAPVTREPALADDTALGASVSVDSGAAAPAASDANGSVSDEQAGYVPDVAAEGGSRPARAAPAAPAPAPVAAATTVPEPVPLPAATPAPAPESTRTPAPEPPARPPARDEPVRRPFEVGERLVYEVRFGPLAVGTATMQVLAITTVRGIPVYHTRFEVRGGNRLYRVQDRYESWFDTRTLASLRYVQDIDEGNYERRSVFEIFPDERHYVEEGKEPQPTVELPLDEGSFIYWMRTIPLEVGRTYSFDRYFRPDRNPVRIEVLRRERVKVPAGTFDAIVVRPVIKTKGIFSEGGRAEIWFADDSTRRILQMKSRLSFGSLNLYLK